MNAFAQWIDRHPVLSFLILILIFGIAGKWDQLAEQRALAQEQQPTTAMQLQHICSMPWPDKPGTAQARARICPKE